MQHTGAVISGSAVLTILPDYQFIPNDLDFFVLPVGFGSVLKYIEDNGYDIVPYDVDVWHYFDQQLVVVNMIHRTSGANVNVVTGVKTHVVGLITDFCSTLVMNYIGWYGLVVLYPDWTFCKSGLIIGDVTRWDKWLMKYVERGVDHHRDVFELAGPLEEHRCRVHPYCPASTRSLYDGYSYVEPFEPNDFDFKASERNFEWLLPVTCSFETLSFN
jgi:hypothetical protein